MKNALQSYVATTLLNGERPELGEDTDLLTSGILDSLGVMMLVGFIETEIGVEVPPEDVTIENFRTIASIDDYLMRRGAADAEP